MKLFSPMSDRLHHLQENHARLWRCLETLSADQLVNGKHVSLDPRAHDKELKSFTFRSSRKHLVGSKLTITLFLASSKLCTPPPRIMYGWKSLLAFPRITCFPASVTNGICFTKKQQWQHQVSWSIYTEKLTTVHLSWKKEVLRIRKLIMMEKNNGVIGVQRSPEQTLQSNATTDGHHDHCSNSKRHCGEVN